MSRANAADWEEFFRQWYPVMVRMGLAGGAGHSDAYDIASAVAICVWRSWTRWIAVEDKDKRRYLHTAVVRELARTRKKRAGQHERESRWGLDPLRPTPYDSAAGSHGNVDQLDGVREAMAILTPRQREVLVLLYIGQLVGWDVKDIADALGIHPDTIRRHRQNMRRSLVSFVGGNGHEHRRWLRAGERLHEDFHRGGQPSPLGLRPIILDAWNLAQERGLDPDRGTEVVLLDPSDLRQRREQSPIPARSPVLSELVDLAARHELLAVVLDADSIVLHRGGHRKALAAADRLGYVEGVCWDLDHAGVNAVGLARILGRPVTVNRFEHTFPDQHRLCCLAMPIRTPDSGHIILNLTTTTDALTKVPVAIHRQLHVLAHRLHRQLWAPRGSEP
ncbi:helix-turn-helix transcriptional regulator [Kibdelosporangium aridum]|uniref:Helix-turn-helix transcriptional regulator n=1 Tax=Kibdelosporangium aridum TaxID=2030 RepID=A0A428Z2P0_KIBAR|nr:sigma factor-like helix-turn-helix DNA-binding protein [Kibdelosporangium aridum]RSM79998.1 helix-turn-helix transcriptional regulator [Kibdelosporangium aridum]